MHLDREAIVRVEKFEQQRKPIERCVPAHQRRAMIAQASVASVLPASGP